MYANILRKAAAQEARQPEQAHTAEVKPFPQKRRAIPAWRRWGIIAACFALLTVLSVYRTHTAGPGEGSAPPVMGVSPFEDVTGPEDFAKHGFYHRRAGGGGGTFLLHLRRPNCPGGFTLNEHANTYEAARLDGNFSRAEGEAVGSTTLDAEYGAVLDRLSPDTWRAHWNINGVNCYLTNFDGAGKEAMTNAAQALIAAACQ